MQAANLESARHTQEGTLTSQSRNFRSIGPRTVAGLSLAALLPLAGCLSVTSAPTSGSPVVPVTSAAGTNDGVTLRGYADAGLLPLVGADVYVFVAGTNGYGSASASLLDTTAAGVSTDSSGNGFVVTDSRGIFSGAVTLLCPSATSQIYLLAIGGHATGTTSNAAVKLISALGSCQNLVANTPILINEVSTAAAITTLRPFLVDPQHIGSSSTNTNGLLNAFGNAADLVDQTTGFARTENIEGTGVVDQVPLNILADVLAPCTASAATTSAPCTALFAAATPSGASAPTDTFAAMQSIVASPGRNVAGLFALITGVTPFQPIPSVAPNDLTIGITYAGAGLNTPIQMAIDSNGNGFVSDCPTCFGLTGVSNVVGFSPRGEPLTGANGFTNGLHGVQAIAWDNSGNLWTIDEADNTHNDEVIKLTGTGAIAGGFPYSSSSLNEPLGIALDPTGNAWVSSGSLNSLIKVSGTGALAAGPVTSPGFQLPFGIAITPANQIYAAGNQSSSILRFNGQGTVKSGTGAGYTAGVQNPVNIALDNAGDVWSTTPSGTVAEISATGTAISPAGGYVIKASAATDIAIDGAGTAWLTNCRFGCSYSNSTLTDSLIHLSATGTLLSLSDGYQNAHFNGASGSAIDGSGNIWVANPNAGTITQVLGIAAPVRTPVAAAVANNQVGVLP